MRIDTFNVTQSSTHQQSSEHIVRESLQAWIGQSADKTPFLPPSANKVANGDKVQLSEEGLAKASSALLLYTEERLRDLQRGAQNKAELLMNRANQAAYAIDNERRKQWGMDDESLARQAPKFSAEGYIEQSAKLQKQMEAIEKTAKDPALLLLKKLVSLLIGREVDVFDSTNMAATLSKNTAQAIDSSNNSNNLTSANTPITPIDAESHAEINATDASNAPTAPEIKPEPAPKKPSPEENLAALQSTASAAMQEFQSISSARFGVDYQYFESYQESESTHYSASGLIKTEDGQSIDFLLALSMRRNYREEATYQLSIDREVRRLKDPLVINFGANSAELSSQRFSFDLDADGTNEDLAFVGAGSGFLVLDKNADGEINDGTELFGAQSGNGFADLAAYDKDNNGWIDENDAIYDDLKVWTKNASGNDQLRHLKEANVGAIHLGATQTEFSLKDAHNNLQGQIRASSFYLHENGGVSSVQQVDLAV